MTAISSAFKKTIKESTDGKTAKPNKNSAAAFKLVKGGESAGVYHITEDGERFLICSPLEILAETQTRSGENYGKWLRWVDSKGRIKTWAMPSKLLIGNSVEFAQYLVSLGLVLGTNRSHIEKLKNYINLSPTDATVICTAKLGWNEDDYVFPDETIGASKDTVVYQPDFAPAHKFGVKGTLKEWQENVGRFCAGNSRLAFAVSVAFASVILPKTEIQSGGFHNRGGTSSGKTTISFVAGSVFGGADDELNYCQSWKATANGLESVAETHNHALLCLDELAQIDGKQAAEVSYMLANGLGKIRQTKNITGKRSLSWQLLFLSTGEISLADKMREAGLTSKAGQEIRVCDIPADTCQFGVFDNLHEFADGQRFADHLRGATRKFYGSPIREFLKKIIEIDAIEFLTGWQQFKDKFVSKILPDEKYPLEVGRVAGRFALVAFAGEMATNLGITGWNSGEASEQTSVVFKAWLENRGGTGSTDEERAISQIRAFIEAHGSSRFEMLTSTDESLDTSKIINRAGFRKLNDDGKIDYLFLPETFRREVCKGFDYKFVCKVLKSRDLLRHDAAGFQKQMKYAGDQLRPYWVSSAILNDGEKQKAQTADASK